MKLYEVTNKFKKTVVETEIFRKGDIIVQMDTLWRWGKWFVEAEDESVFKGDYHDMQDFEVVECSYLDDGCGLDFYIQDLSGKLSEEEIEELLETVQEGYDGAGMEFFEINDYEDFEYEVTVHGELEWKEIFEKADLAV